MPVYEYYCKGCDGVFEAIRQVAQASDPAPCPLCKRKAPRMMPTSFAAFTMREGYPRAIPDRGTYYHLGKEVKKKITGGTRMNEHPEINKPRPKPQKSKGERAVLADKRQAEARERAYRKREGVREVIDNTRRRDDD